MPIITISRGSMSGGQALAAAIAVQIDAPCVGRELVVDAAARLGVPGDVLRQKMEKSPGLWDRMTQDRRMYVTALQAALAEHVVTGNLVYHGFVGHLLLRNVPAVLRVRVIAPIAARVRAVMDQHGWSKAAAERHIAQVDQDRARWVRFIYDEDIDDPRLYDLVINLEAAGLESACACVLALAGRPEFTITPEVRRRLGNFALACRVKAALAAAPPTRTLDLSVTAEDGAVTVEGEVPDAAMITGISARWEAEVHPIVEAVDGVTRVALRLRAVYPHA
jgi:cytidylate kinase